MSQVSNPPLREGNILILLGSNAASRAGEPIDTLRAALLSLDDGPLSIRARSHFYSSPFLPRGSEPDVVNAVIDVQTKLSADALLSHLHAIEARFDRERIGRWSSRTLDLDLLTFKDKIAPDQSTLREWVNLSADQQRKKTPPELLVPHPRLQDRAFALVPACDVAPLWVHPLLGLSTTAMRDALPASDINDVQRIASA